VLKLFRILEYQKECLEGCDSIVEVKNPLNQVPTNETTTLY